MATILMEKKPEFENHYTVKGDRIIKYPHIYQMAAETV